MVGEGGHWSDSDAVLAVPVGGSSWHLVRGPSRPPPPASSPATRPPRHRPSLRSPTPMSEATAELELRRIHRPPGRQLSGPPQLPALRPLRAAARIDDHRG